MVIVCLWLLITGFYGCGITRATQQVLANSAAFNKVGTTWANLNPCVVDSTKTLVHDTTVKTDTAYKLVTTATASGGLMPTQTGANQPAQPSGYHSLDTLVQTITKTITLHDSVKIVSVDKRQLGICNDSVTFYKVLYANYQANAIGQIDGWKHKARTRLWFLIAVIALVGVYVCRKPLLSAIGGLPALLTTKL